MGKRTTCVVAEKPKAFSHLTAEQQAQTSKLFKAVEARAEISQYEFHYYRLFMDFFSAAFFRITIAWTELLPDYAELSLSAVLTFWMIALIHRQEFRHPYHSPALIEGARLLKQKQFSEAELANAKTLADRLNNETQKLKDSLAFHDKVFETLPGIALFFAMASTAITNDIPYGWPIHLTFFCFGSLHTINWTEPHKPPKNPNPTLLKQLNLLNSAHPSLAQKKWTSNTLTLNTKHIDPLILQVFIGILKDNYFFVDHPEKDTLEVFRQCALTTSEVSSIQKRMNTQLAYIDTVLTLESHYQNLFKVHHIAVQCQIFTMNDTNIKIHLIVQPYCQLTSTITENTLKDVFKENISNLTIVLQRGAVKIALQGMKSIATLRDSKFLKKVTDALKRQTKPFTIVSAIGLFQSSASPSLNTYSAHAFSWQHPETQETITYDGDINNTLLYLGQDPKTNKRCYAYFPDNTKKTASVFLPQLIEAFNRKMGPNNRINQHWGIIKHTDSKWCIQTHGNPQVSASTILERDDRLLVIFDTFVMGEEDKPQRFKVPSNEARVLACLTSKTLQT